MNKTALQAAIQDTVDRMAYAYWEKIEAAVKLSLRAAVLWDGKEPASELFARLPPEQRPVLETFADGSVRVIVMGTVMAIVEPPQVLPRHTFHVGVGEAARKSRAR